MRKTIITAMIMFLICLLVMPAACIKPAEFQVTSLVILPVEVVENETVNVAVDIENIGGQKGTYIAILAIDGVETETKEVTLAPADKETATFNITKEAAGTYEVGVGGLTGILRVLRPAEFIVSNLVISPPEPEVWEEVTITVKVENIGDIEGTHTVNCEIDGEEVEKQDVTIDGGEAETVAFTFMRDVGPSCDIEIDGLTQTITITEGVLPIFAVGDRWTWQYIFENFEYEMTYEVTGEGVSFGKDCYFMEGSMEPPMPGWHRDFSAKADKTTANLVKVQMTGDYLGEPLMASYDYSYEYPGAHPYPLEVGKEYELIMTTTEIYTHGGGKTTETRMRYYIEKVEAIEEITVPAGTFRCFKIVRYDPETDTAVLTVWVSDKTKHVSVKEFNLESEAGIQDTELVSCSFSSIEPTPEPEPSYVLTPTVAFTRYSDDAWEEKIFLINTDGSGLKQLTLEDNVQEHFPQISPDGAKIAFGRQEKGGTWDIYLMNADGSGRVQITDEPGNDMPAWSPDGRYIAFMSARDGNYEIYIMASDGSNQRRLTDDPGLDWLPVWSPDGSTIAFLSNRDGEYKWWLMNMDGSDQRLLADIVILEDLDLPISVMLLRATWSTFFEGTFFTPLITEEEAVVIGIDVDEGTRGGLTFTDALNLVEAPEGELVMTYFSSSTNSWDLALMLAGPVLDLTSSPEHDIASSCELIVGQGQQ